MARMGDGRVVRAQTDFGKGPQQPQKFLIVLQYYNGDVAEVEELANIIADMERVRNKDADILLFGRFDANPFPSHVKAKLESKFEKVHELKCRSRDGTSYPFATNCMFYDLVTLLGQYPAWNDPYFAFINLEADCVPVHPGWIKELIEAFKIAQVHGKHCIGHVDLKHYTPHMNGLAVYAIDIFSKVPGGKIGGGPLNLAYDIYQSKNLLPISQDTPLIMFSFRRPTITAEELFRPHKSGIEPAIYHGVKDASAREAVKARHITFSSNKDLSRTTVFTYYGTPSDVGHGESNEILELWKQGWQSRGWNPVVLRLMEASKHPRFAAMQAAVERLSFVGDKQEQKNQFYRWLALDSMGGGLLVNMDQLPNAFTPGAKVEAMTWRKGQELDALITQLIDYTIQSTDTLNGNPHVTDSTVFMDSLKLGSRDMDTSEPRIVNYGGLNWREADIVDFNEQAIIASPKRGKRKSDVMQEYLRGA